MLNQTKLLQRANSILNDLKIYEALQEYSPTLTGTIPIGIEIPESDLDIICEAHDLIDFQSRIVDWYGHMEDFKIKQDSIGDVPTVVASFIHDAFPIEIFGQPIPVAEQHAYRHMQIEARLLTFGGVKAQQAIRQLKLSGLKTEPAFAAYFGLDGDPYQHLLTLAELSDEKLQLLIQDKPEDCVFCDIAASREEASRVFENDHTLAFMNLRQANEGHVLVIPKKHYPRIYDLDNEIASQLMKTVVIVSQAVNNSVHPEGISIWQSNGEAAGQEIDHVHVHILPRYSNDQVIHFYPDPPQPRERDDLDRMAQKIKAKIQAKLLK